MREKSKTTKYIETLPGCNVDGWPRYCHHHQVLEWVHKGQTLAILPVSTLAISEEKGKDPEFIINDFMNFMREAYH